MVGYECTAAHRDTSHVGNTAIVGLKGLWADFGTWMYDFKQKICSLVSYNDINLFLAASIHTRNSSL